MTIRPEQPIQYTKYSSRLTSSQATKERYSSSRDTYEKAKFNPISNRSTILELNRRPKLYRKGYRGQ